MTLSTMIHVQTRNEPRSQLENGRGVRDVDLAATLAHAGADPEGLFGGEGGVWEGVFLPRISLLLHVVKWNHFMASVTQA